MKIYTRILGIISFLVVLALIVVLVIYTIDEKEWLYSFLLLIPIYSLFHYLIITRLGFFKEEILDKKQGRSLLILSIISFVILIITPLILFQTSLALNKRFAEPIDWGKSITVYEINCDLTTRILDNRIEYIFNAKFGDERKLIKSFNITFYDSFGFYLFGLEIEDWTNIVDKDSKVIGISSKSSRSVYEIKKIYKNIDNYSVSITEY